MVEAAAGAADPEGGVGRLQVRVSGEAGGALHDPEEVMRQVAEIVLGGLEMEGAQGELRRIHFDGAQIARAFADARLLDFMRVEMSYVVLGALGDFIFARSEVGAATRDVRKELETLLVAVELHLSERVNRLGSRTQQRLMSAVREALGEETERKLIRIEREDRRRKKQLIRDLTRRVLDAFGEGLEEFRQRRETYQRQAEQGFDEARSLPEFNRILESNLNRVFDLVWALRFQDAIEETLGEYEAQRALSGYDVMQALDYTKHQVLPQARAAFVGMLLGTYRPHAGFARGASLVAPRIPGVGR